MPRELKTNTERKCDTCEHNDDVNSLGILGCACPEVTQTIGGESYSNIALFADDVILDVMDAINFNTECPYYMITEQENADDEK